MKFDPTLSTLALITFATPALAQTSSPGGGAAMPAGSATVPGPQPLGTETYFHDVGSTQNDWGGGVATTCWLQAYSAEGGSDTITEVLTSYGTPAFPGSLATGLPVQILIYEDPNDDMDPTDGVLLWSTAGVTTSVDTDILISYPVNPPVTVSGVFFIGAACTHNANDYPAPRDTTQSSLGRAWMCRSNGAGVVFNINNLGANDFPPQDMDNFAGGASVFRIRANGGTLGTNYCLSTINSTGASATMGANGSGRISANNLTLCAIGVPQVPGIGIFIAGPGLTQQPIFDGFLCINPVGLERINVITPPVANKVTQTIDLTMLSVTAGLPFHFQHWFRDPNAGGTGANLTDGIIIDITP